MKRLIVHLFVVLFVLVIACTHVVAEKDYVIDLTQTRSEPRAQVDQHVVSRGGFPPPRWPKLPIKLTLHCKGVATMSKVANCSVTLKNIGKQTIQLPASPTSAVLRSDRYPYSYQELTIILYAANADSSGNAAGLFGAPRVPESLLALYPGDRLRIKFKAPILPSLNRTGLTRKGAALKARLGIDEVDMEETNAKIVESRHPAAKDIVSENEVVIRPARKVE